MDQAITHWINSFAGSNRVLDSLMIMTSVFGVPLLVFVTALQWFVQSERLHVRHACVAAGLSFLLGLGINQIILLFIHRVRPYDAGVTHLIISRSGDWSFPSDHATVTFAIATAFLFQHLQRRGLVYLAAALLVCLSRIYVGTHYATDVLGGAVTGVLAATAARMVYWEGTRVDRLITSIW
ncbi:MAG: phosphatase PAP2 family protein [Methylovirgula sp.]